MDIVGERTLKDLLNEQTSRYQDKVFLHFEDITQQKYELTYGEFVDTVNRLSNVFIDFFIIELFSKIFPLLSLLIEPRVIMLEFFQSIEHGLMAVIKIGMNKSRNYGESAFM